MLILQLDCSDLQVIDALFLRLLQSILQRHSDKLSIPIHVKNALNPASLSHLPILAKPFLELLGLYHRRKVEIGLSAQDNPFALQNLCRLLGFFDRIGNGVDALERSGEIRLVGCDHGVHRSDWFQFDVHVLYRVLELLRLFEEVCVHLL